MKASAIKGALFEALVLRFATMAGHRVVERDDKQVFERSGLRMVHGLGEAHNADVLLEPSIRFPLTPPTQLVVECKGHSKGVGLGVVRGAVGLRHDLNGFRRLSDEMLEARTNGQQTERAEQFPHFHVAVASLHGFSVPAQHYAAAHHIELLDYEGLPILGELASEFGRIVDSADDPPRGWQRYIQRQLIGQELFERCDALPRPEDATDDEIRIGLGNRTVDVLSRVSLAASSVGASYVATLASGLTVNMLASSPLPLPTGVRGGADFTFWAGFDDVASDRWRLTAGKTTLEFTLPPELFAVVERSASPRKTAALLKETEMQTIGLIGPFQVGNSTVIRHCVGEIDRDRLLARMRRVTPRRMIEIED